MIVSFHTQDLRDRCSRIAIAMECLGTLHARELIELIADIEALENADQLADLRGPDVCKGEPASLSITIGSAYCAIFTPVGSKFTYCEAGGVDWSSVRRLKLMVVRRRR